MQPLLFHILAAASVLSAAAILHGFGPASWRRHAAATVGLTVALIAVSFLGANGVFHFASLLAYGLFLYAPLYFVGAGLRHWRQGRLKLTVNLGVAVALLLIAGDALLVEPTAVQFTELTIASPKVTVPLRIVFVTDLQTDAPGPHELDVLKRTMAWAPDLLLFGGDYIQRGREPFESDPYAALRGTILAAGVRAPLGAYAVRGNIDSPREWQRVFTGTGVKTVAVTDFRDLGEIELMLLSYPDSLRDDLDPQETAAFRVVMGHTPDHALSTPNADLVLAGHTHGGQVRWPFVGPILTLSGVPRSFASGVSKLPNGGTLVVSNGIGMERRHAPQVRFLCRPEVNIINIVPTVGPKDDE